MSDTRGWLTVLVAAALTLPAAAASGAQPAQELAPLDNRSRAAIGEALADELRGEALYARVVKDHGDVRPFSNVVRAERRHAELLADLLKSRGLAVPDRAATTAKPPAYPSVKEACAAAVAFEAQNVALYDRLMAAGPLPDDVRRIFQHNRTASLDRHTKAFERCGGLATARGPGAAQGCQPGVRGNGSWGCAMADQRARPCGHGCGHGCGNGGDHGFGHGHGHACQGCGQGS